MTHPDDDLARVLRTRLDQELAHLDVTPEARRRLREATVRSGHRPVRVRPRASTRGGRWSVPLVAAAVAVTVVAVPVTATRWLRSTDGTHPTATVPVLPAGPPPTGTAPAPASTVPTSPIPTPSTPPLPAQALLRLLVAPAGRAARAGQPVTLTVSRLPAGTKPVTGGKVPLPTAVAPAPPSAAGALRSATPPAVAGSPGPARLVASVPSRLVASVPSRTATIAQLVIDWGDGLQDGTSVACTVGGKQAPEQLPFRHVYRSTGRYHVTARLPLPAGCGSRELIGQAVVVVK